MSNGSSSDARTERTYYFKVYVVALILPFQQNMTGKYCFRHIYLNECTWWNVITVIFLCRGNYVFCFVLFFCLLLFKSLGEIAGCTHGKRVFRPIKFTYKYGCNASEYFPCQSYVIQKIQRQMYIIYRGPARRTTQILNNIYYYFRKLPTVINITNRNNIIWN